MIQIMIPFFFFKNCQESIQYMPRVIQAYSPNIREMKPSANFGQGKKKPSYSQDYRMETSNNQ